MRFSEKWLREWVDPPVGTDELCDQLTMAGLEVDAVEPAGPALDRVVVGRIREVAPHPAADRLVICRVDTGEDAPRRIVCGAPNAAVDLVAPVALPGAVLPGGTEIAEGEIRGEASQGMLCGASELGLGDDDSGLMTLDPDAAPGTPLVRHLGLDDSIVEIDLTPNRGDCLSVRGIAREVGVRNRRDVAAAASDAVQADIEDRPEVRIEAEKACPVYAGRIIVDVDPAARTPDWMRERLRRGGIRPISPVVDVTNYVMLELGQPMHAFDRSRLRGAIRVREAEAGERIELLDGQEVTLEAGTLVIADDSGPVAIAGVMGGAATAVDEATREIVLESACFSPLAVAGQGRRYKIHTDSLHRFERGVDPHGQVAAIERATALIRTIAGGRVGHVTVTHGYPLWEDREIRLRHEHVERLLGCHIPGEEISEILVRLDMKVVSEDVGSWLIHPPSHRFDLALEADLVEEVARVHGYERLPSRPRRIAANLRPIPEARRPHDALQEILRQRGYDEAITYSFVEPELQAALDPEAAKVAIDLDNPIAAQYAQMRTTLWSGLLPAWRHNLRRQQPRVRLFELGLRFARDADAELGIRQTPTLAGLAAGPAADEHWDADRRALDFFDVKGDVEALLANVDGDVTFEAARHPALHPGRAARIAVAGRPCGWLGQLHPKFQKILDVKALPYVFELDSEVLEAVPVPRFEALSEYPSVRRDLALLVPEGVPAGDLVATALTADVPHLQSAHVFDVFRGGDLETGFKSVALGLIFQDKTSTLTDQGVDSDVTRLTAALQDRCGARVRGQ
ncbi:phenylalanyl-tRNA synthetase subunit beta [Salinisphaera sp. PC39]|uniref:phenylalanine--tRNA ligase subunit beta n=1 Tax=Salinisphaera sp. PC39 TaxID=1304156 RepID=UPI0033410809